MEIFISKKNIDKKVLIETLKHKEILCNIYPYDSIVYSKQLEIYHKEQGFKIELFNVGHSKLVSLWDTLRNNINIHCVYVKYKNYEGCITQLPEYLDYCKKNNIKPLKCSEY